MSSKYELVDDEHAASLDILVLLCKDLLRAWGSKLGLPDYSKMTTEQSAEYNSLRLRLVFIVGKLMDEYPPLTGDDNDLCEKVADEIDAKAVTEFSLWQIKRATEEADPTSIPDD